MLKLTFLGTQIGNIEPSSQIIYILKAQLLFVCLFVCPELIGKTTSPRKLKVCIHV